MVLTAGARAEFSRGYIFNLVTSDADNVQQMCNQVFSLVSAPIRIVAAMALLYAQLGVAAFAALTLLICVIPVQVHSRTVFRSLKEINRSPARHLRPQS
jgi:ATP-binding cassette, subfamily C (CFTR/MRP), member 1